MDLEVKGLAFSDSNTMIEYQAFTPEGAKEGKQTTRSGEDHGVIVASAVVRSEEHTSELQSLMRISYAVFCLKKKIRDQQHTSSIKHNNIRHQLLTSTKTRV